jgi:hypothetical protein
MPGPGSRFGHDVTMRHLRVCALATDGAASAAVALATKIFRRVIPDMTAAPKFVFHHH